MGAQISANLSSGFYSREQQYLNIKSKADLARYIKYANKSTLMVINFTTTWCEPCQKAEDPMRNLAKKFNDVKFARVDIDLLQDVVDEFDLKTMPTVLLCKRAEDGVDRGNGAAGVEGGSAKQGNRLTSDTEAKQGNGLASATQMKNANSVKEGNSVTASATQEKITTSVTEANNTIPSVAQGKSATSMREGNDVVPNTTEKKGSTRVKEANSAAASGTNGESTTANAKECKRIASATSVKEGNSVPNKINSMKNGDNVNGVKEGDRVPSRKKRIVKAGKSNFSIYEIDRMERPLQENKLENNIEFHKNNLP